MKKKKATTRHTERQRKCARCTLTKLCRFVQTGLSRYGWAYICKKCRKSNRHKLPLKEAT